MKAVIITQEEPFYLPVFMSKILAEYRRVNEPDSVNFLELDAIGLHSKPLNKKMRQG